MKLELPKTFGEWMSFAIAFVVLWIATVSIAKRSQAFNNLISTGI